MASEAVEVRLARIEEKIDQILKRDSDHEDRIRVLEKLVWRLSGAATGIGGLIGFAASIIWRG